LEGLYYEKGTKPTCFGFVDVRDVAEAHIRAMEHKDASGRYLLISSTGISYFELSQMLVLSGKFGQYKLPIKQDGSIANRPLYNNSKAQTELGLKLTPIETSVVDMANALIELDMIQQTKNSSL